MNRAILFSTHQTTAGAMSRGDNALLDHSRNQDVRLRLIEESRIIVGPTTMSPERDQPVPARRARYPPRAARNHARLLVAEDDPELRHLLATVLRRDGHHVTEVRTGTELLDWLALELDTDGELARCDLIVSDIRLPGFSGLDMLASLRTAECQVPVVLITGFGDDETHALALRLGATALFDKPFDMNDLREAIAQSLDQA